MKTNTDEYIHSDTEQQTDTNIARHTGHYAWYSLPQDVTKEY